MLVCCEQTEIGALAEEILRAQHARFENKATPLNGLVGSLRAKVTWLEKGSKGRGPNVADDARNADDPADTGRRSVVKRTAKDSRHRNVIV
jgi:hypothetical protein